MAEDNVQDLNGSYMLLGMGHLFIEVNLCCSVVVDSYTTTGFQRKK